MDSPTRPQRHRPSPLPPPRGTGTPPPSSATRGTSSPLHARLQSNSSTHPLHDAAVDELCQHRTFQNNFNPNTFVARLSEKLVARSNADPGPFHPRPFIRTFEAAVDALLSIRSQVTSQTVELGSAVRVAESAYASKLRELGSNFTAVEESFTSLEARISEVGRTAIRIGEQLESVARQRTRAQEAHDLVEHYYAFARGDTSRLDQMRREGGKEGRLRIAVVTRRLQAISREIDIDGAEATRETIDKYCERFERDMLKLFDKFYRRSDPRTMAHIARVLTSFNGGQSCVQIYVNQHDFFISKDRVVEAAKMEDSPIWRNLSDPDTAPPKLEPALANLFDEIRKTVSVEAQIITAVFPAPMLVMQTFLQRVFAQSVQGYIEVLMDRAVEVGAHANAGLQIGSGSGTTALQNGTSAEAGHHSLAFLRTLHMVRSCTLALVNDLKVYDYRGLSNAANGSLVTESHTLSLGSIAPTSLPTSAPEGGAATGGPGSSLGGMLDLSVEELFMPYMEGQRYLEKEIKNLGELYSAHLAKFILFHRTSHRNKAATTTTIFDRVRAGMAGASATAPTPAAPAAPPPTASKSAFLNRLVDRARVAASGGIPAPAGGPTTAAAESAPAAVETDGAVEAPHDDADGELSLDVAERLLRWHAEAIGRCVDLSTPADVPKNVFALLKVLADAFHKSYVEVALDTAYTLAGAQDTRGATLPDMTPILRAVRTVDLIEALWNHYVNTALVPLASASVTVRRELGIFNNHNLLRVEGKCEAVLQRLTDNVITYLSTRLATQKKNDFMPKNDELAFARMNTDPCLACTDALERLHGAVKASLHERNAKALLTEVGVTFHGMLLEHLRKYTVSAAGGLMLTKDLAMYQDAVSSFGIPAVSDRYEMLRQLGNLFIVQPAVLKSYMQEAHLAKIEERLLRPYLLRRADYVKDVRDLDDMGDGTGQLMPLSAGPGSGNAVGAAAMQQVQASAVAGAAAGNVGTGTGMTAGFPLTAGQEQEDLKTRELGALMRDLEAWSSPSGAARTRATRERGDEEQEGGI